MTIYQPYFYIIQDTHNGRYYAGAKWAQNSNPNTFMKSGGYTTSSTVIKGLLEKDGIDRFIIRKIRIFQLATEAFDYETRFLKKVNARQNQQFYNEHNNDGAMNSEYMRKYLLCTYGVDHNSKIKDTQEKRLKSIQETYGSFSAMMRETGGSKNSLASFKANTGLSNPFLLPNVIAKREATNLIKYGHKNPFMNSDVQKHSRNAAIEAVRKQNDERHKENINKILSCDINFSKRGWVGSVSKLIGITPQHVSRWMKRNMPDFYQEYCLIRKIPE